MIEPSANFKENLARLPSIDGIVRIELRGADERLDSVIENQPGKQGSLAVYHYLQQQFGTLDARAAAHGLAVFGEHTADALAHPGKHPNVDRLLALRDGAPPYTVRVVRAA
ncbi:hypothetical protein PATSB16_10160 [Pandoraea thiooxydans]|uniref:RNA polymerase factor sigma-32 n=1 Tax=Pandoraea thiooxydans TaxID=445709 RepID=A0A0G3EPS5_9BURK|nr:DUF2322 family protein [Pandoraea thiooxydans]AKJ67342.1 hypothetical protein ABW99_02950 [Pandoraea thiooxydans]APR94358.1 hypothetical protein PATSB16_10160 [Pandoraea thiooxydans]